MGRAKAKNLDESGMCRGCNHPSHYAVGGKGLKALPSPAARWNAVYRAASRGSGVPHDKRLREVTAAAKEGDQLAQYVLGLTRILGVNVEEKETA